MFENRQGVKAYFELSEVAKGQTRRSWATTKREIGAIDTAFENLELKQYVRYHQIEGWIPDLIPEHEKVILAASWYQHEAFKR